MPHKVTHTHTQIIPDDFHPPLFRFCYWPERKRKEKEKNPPFLQSVKSVQTPFVTIIKIYVRVFLLNTKQRKGRRDVNGTKVMKGAQTLKKCGSKKKEKSNKFFSVLTHSDV